MVFTTEATKKKWKNLFDDFGDSFREDSTAADLRLSLDQVEVETSPKQPDLRLELEQELSGYPYYLLRGKVFYFESTTGVNDRQLLGLRCELYGGAVADRLSEGVTHVIVKASSGLTEAHEAAYRRERQYRLKKGAPLFHVVSSSWLLQSIVAARMLDEVDFEL